MKRYGLRGNHSRDLLSFGGRVLYHGNRAELEFLVPVGARVVELPRSIRPDQTLHISLHPQMATVRWPLCREEFRRA